MHFSQDPSACTDPIPPVPTHPSIIEVSPCRVYIVHYQGRLLQLYTPSSIDLRLHISRCLGDLVPVQTTAPCHFPPSLLESLVCFVHLMKYWFSPPSFSSTVLCLSPDIKSSRLSEAIIRFSQLHQAHSASALNSAEVSCPSAWYHCYR